MKDKEPFINKNGYSEGNQHSDLISRKVAYEQIYLKNRDKYPLRFSQYIIHHINGEKLNNSITNLYICTTKEHNQIHNEQIKNKKRFKSSNEINSFLKSRVPEGQKILNLPLVKITEEPSVWKPITNESTKYLNEMQGKYKKNNEMNKGKQMKMNKGDLENQKIEEQKKREAAELLKIEQERIIQKKIEKQRKRRKKLIIFSVLVVILILFILGNSILNKPTSNTLTESFSPEITNPNIPPYEVFAEGINIKAINNQNEEITLLVKYKRISNWFGINEEVEISIPLLPEEVKIVPDERFSNMQMNNAPGEIVLIDYQLK
jgi:predicted nucleic acid-binding Zn ribbon protein